MPDHDAHDIIVLFSARSRDAYAAEATARGETYTFTDAWGLPRTWVKGEYAYLAPNAAGLLLARCNLKHHLVEEAALDAARLARCRALLIANAGHLAPETIARIEAWLAGGDRRLIVTGKTNLPPHLLGLQSCEPAPVQGYTGWRWRAGSPFAGDAWETLYVSGYKGHPAHRIVPAKGSRVLADLVELSGDLSDATTATVGELGPAIVLTDRTVYVANQVFELIGGMMQAHLNVEAVRHWANATHWGDTLLFFLRRLMREVGLASLWQTRLRSFGTYDGVLSFRHDVHGMRDYTFLDYQIQNLIPASYDIEDPTFSTNIDEAMARDWVERTTQHSFIEPALHNDSSIGDPPTAIFGKGLFEHVSKAGKSLGITICTCGRHAGGHMHPETIDAMDYLYAQDKTILGLCTFCYYHMIEYGVRDPNVMVGGTIGEKPLTYVTDVRRTIATSGIWFPFRPVVTTTRSGASCAAGTARTNTMPPTSWSRPSSPATARVGPASTTSSRTASIPSSTIPSWRAIPRSTAARARSTTCATASTSPNAATTGSPPKPSSTNAWPTTKGSASRCATAAARSRSPTRPTGASPR